MKQLRIVAPLTFIVFALLFYSCDEIYDPIMVSGRVIDVGSGSP